MSVSEGRKGESWELAHKTMLLLPQLERNFGFSYLLVAFHLVVHRTFRLSLSLFFSVASGFN